MDIYEIIRRWHTGGSIRGIARRLQIDRKTVRRYLKQAQQLGVSRDQPLPEAQLLREKLVRIVPSRERTRPARQQLEPHREEILALIDDPEEPVTLKSAWKVIRHRHPHITASYSALKRVVRDWQPNRRPATWRHETPPGLQTQLDYGKVGLLHDRVADRRRAVYCFAGVLSWSRYKFIQYVWSQNAQSFVGSHLAMFNFWGGASQTLVTDCLKSAVIKPDLYDPKLNPLYRQMAEHYGCFIDPARPGRPKDKGKVERVIAPARELFRYLKKLNPQLTLADANRQALHWCRHENGMTPHGTTGEPPWERFIRDEKPVLLALPDEEFELAEWKPVTVHPDQYVQYDKAYYSLPDDYVGWTLWLRAGQGQIELYDKNLQLIKTFPRATRPGSRLEDPADFPDNVAAMMNRYSVRKLMNRAERVGPATAAYLTELLRPHAMRNLRKAMGILDLAEKYPPEAMETASRQARRDKQFTYKAFRRLLEAPQGELPIAISSRTASWVRDGDYFTHSTTNQQQS